MYLLIVESPAKAKTIAGYLSARPEGWEVVATGGHLFDLPKSRLGIATENGHYVGDWQLSQDKRGVLETIRAAVARCEKVFIGADDDREGERIAADVARHLGLTDYARITFREITPAAIQQAVVSGLRGIDDQRVCAQIARRLVDRQIGYPVSQIMRWHLPRQQAGVRTKGIGRVSAPALRILCATEEAIARFVPEPYTKLVADYSVDQQNFRLTLPKKFTGDEWEARDQALDALRTQPHRVWNYQYRNLEVPPYPPLTTARLQRCCFYLFGFEPKKTMQLAQELYEGIAVGGVRHGLITYPRTDSIALSDAAVADIITLLDAQLPDDRRSLLLTTPRHFVQRAEAQQAHEAIRPTQFTAPFWPESLREALTKDQLRVYDHIWFRTLATQLKDATYDVSVLTVDVAGQYRLSARANACLEPGWEWLNGEREHASERQDEDEDKSRTVCFPALDIGAEVTPLECQALELTNRCPPRYGIGRFLTMIDNKGIGRPSTLDGIIDGLKQRGYVETRGGFLYVTDTGLRVDQWLTTYAPWLNDTNHARDFEHQLDQVERGEADYNTVIADYVARVAALKEQIGYEDSFAEAPSAKQVAYAEALARRRQVELPEHVVANRQELSAFISQHRPLRELIGRCPACGQRSVYAYEAWINCNAIGCDFKVSLTRLQQFCDHFLREEDPVALATALTRRRRTLIPDLTGKSGKPFAAYCYFARNAVYGWGVEYALPSRGRAAVTPAGGAD